MIQNGIVHFGNASRVGNFELFVTLGLFFMAADADADTGGNLRGRHADNVVPESGPFPGRNGNSGKGHKETVCEHDL